MRIRYSILALGLSCVACSSTTPEPVEPQGTVDTGPVIVRVISRDTTIVARSSANGPVYGLEDRNGKVLVPAMSLPELQAMHPELARKVQNTTAYADLGIRD